MLNKGKNVNKLRKVIVALMVIVMTLGVYIKSEATSPDSVGTEEGTTINPIYRPKWELKSKIIDIDREDLENATVTLELEGNAGIETSTLDGGNVELNYSSTVTGDLKAEDITVYINNQKADWIVKSLTIPAESDRTEVDSVTYTLTLSRFEETERQIGVPYKEWSGNIKIRIGGRGEAPETYDADTLVDKYGNQSMMATDETGTWIDVTYDEAKEEPGEPIFIDVIRPEFTYEYSNTIIQGGNIEKVTVVFDVVDQYFESSILTSDLITVEVDGQEVNSSVGVTKSLTKIKNVYYDKTAGTNYVDEGATGTGAHVGERYQLEITGLDKGEAFDYSGYMTLAFPAGIKQEDGTLISGIIDESGNLNPGTTITIGIDEPGESLPKTDYTMPYLPAKFSRVEGTDLSNGLTIQDSSGNQYVWVEVPRTTTVYGTAGLNITEFTDAEYSKIETDLNNYTTDYSGSYTDKYTSKEATGLTNNEYNTLKKKMLKSIYKNGGFYVGRYETGTETARTGPGETTQTPVIKKNAYPYNYVTTAQAQKLASSLSTMGTETSVMFGIQVDLVLKYLEESDAATKIELNSDSTEWGNYKNNAWSTEDNPEAKYSTTGTEWVAQTYGSKESGTSVLLSTGASEEFEKQNIYDLAGNVWERTLENTNSEANPSGYHGGGYNGLGNTRPANYRTSYIAEDTNNTIGFRVALWEDTPVVDVVDPIWTVDNIEIIENPINLKNSTVTIDLTATDKYYLSNVFEEARAAEEAGTTGALEAALRENILLYVDGVLDGDANGNGILENGENPVITKELSTATELTPAGTGVKYTLTFSNWDAEKYSGTARIKIPAGTITDQIVDGRNNASNEQEFVIGHIDFTKPVITKVSSENIDTNLDGKKDSVKIIFKATDKFMVMDELITIPTAAAPSAPDEITVFVDNEAVTGITRTLTNEEITEVVNGVTVKGHQYTLIISNFEQVRTTINRDREFSDWSGTVRIDIAQGAVRDEEVVVVDNSPTGKGSEDQISGGNVNDLTSITGEFADFINPNVTYEYSETDIVRNHDNKNLRKFIMVFDVTDKYFTSSPFAEALTAATTDAEKLAVLQEYLTIWVDGVDVTNVDTVTKKIVGTENVTATINKTTDIINKTITNNVPNAVIGKKFTLEISNLEQEPDITLGYDYLDYSGVITVAFNSGKPLAVDEEIEGARNSNVAGSITTPSITSGVTNPPGSGSGVIVDLVDPLWEQSGAVEARPYDKYAEISIKGTDKYIQKDAFNEVYMRIEDSNTIYDLQSSDIIITVATPSGTIEVDAADEDEMEEKGMTLTVIRDTSVTVPYGKQYKIQLTGYAADAYQVKLTVKDGILEDQSGNTSQETTFVLFSSLAETSTETQPTSEFLAQNKAFGQQIPQRQYVEQVIFKNNLVGINETKWDVSQLNDGTIWAWYTTREAEDGTTLYTVYIGSYVVMFGNVNSSYLFANIGYNTNCKVTGDTTVADPIKLIENLHLLQTASITNMSHMFDGCGYANMKSLDLGDEFYTKSVTNMSNMFQGCGYTSMASLDLGDKFDTSKVTLMRSMFYNCGKTVLQILNFGNYFNTSEVVDMNSMFYGVGGSSTSFATLDLGATGITFNTSNVTTMENMFMGCGADSLKLGDEFNTSKVTKMVQMFNRTCIDK